MRRPERPTERRVVITGLGPVCDIGVGVDAFTDALRAGRTGYGPIRSFDTAGFLATSAGEVHGLRPEEHLVRLRPQDWGRGSCFAAVAARLALTDAGIGDRLPASLPPQRVAVVMGTTSGESQVVDRLSLQATQGSGCRDFDPDDLLRLPAGRLAHAASEEAGAAGPSVTIASACAASNYAIGYGSDLIGDGECDLVLVGGADAVCRWAHAGFHRLGALSTGVCSPFDRDRAGILTAEGGVALALEERDHALDRGARIYAEVLGHGLNCDAQHMVAPSAPSIADCMRLAHRHSGVEPDEVDYICAHGTGTPANDSAEAEAIRAVFGRRPPPVSSVKSMIGHAMGAASGFGAVACALAIREGFLPPTANWRTPDPDFAWLDPVPGQARAATVRIAQNNGFAFGGNNCITVFGEAA